MPIDPQLVQRRKDTVKHPQVNPSLLTGSELDALRDLAVAHALVSRGRYRALGWTLTAAVFLIGWASVHVTVGGTPGYQPWNAPLAGLLIAGISTFFCFSFAGWVVDMVGAGEASRRRQALLDEIGYGQREVEAAEVDATGLARCEARPSGSDDDSAGGGVDRAGGWKSRRQEQHEWYEGHRGLTYQDRRIAEAHDMDVDTYLSNFPD